MTTLGEVCVALVDCEHKTAPIDDNGQFFALGTPAMRGNVINYQEARRVSGETFSAWTRRLTPRAGDILFAREAPVGPVVRIPAAENVAPGQRTVLMRIDPDRADADFIFQMLTGPDVQRRIHERAAGSTVPHLNVPDIKSFDLGDLPPLPEQRAIAEVLGALDDKIAVNEHLVAVSERLLLARVSQAPSEVPVSEVAGHERRSVSPSTMGDQLLSHYSLPAFDEHHVPVVEPASKILSGKFAVTAPCVLMSKLNPRFPRVWDLPVVAESAVASTEFVVLTPRGVSTSALWAALSQPRLGQELEDRAAGTSGSHQRVRPQEILSSKIPDPRSLAEGERTLIANLGRRVFEARVESQKLGALRDALLPELMSGRLTVKDAESQVEEVV